MPNDESDDMPASAVPEAANPPSEAMMITRPAAAPPRDGEGDRVVYVESFDL